MRYSGSIWLTLLENLLYYQIVPIALPIAPMTLSQSAEHHLLEYLLFAASTVLSVLLLISAIIYHFRHYYHDLLVVARS